jgi:hypothetical protein
MSRTAILNVVGLTPRVLGPDTPRLAALARTGGLIRVKPVLPLAATIVLDGPFATSGLCGNANYPGGSTRAPTCRANPPVTSVFCK